MNDLVKSSASRIEQFRERARHWENQAYICTCEIDAQQMMALAIKWENKAKEEDENL